MIFGLIGAAVIWCVLVAWLIRYQQNQAEARLPEVHDLHVSEPERFPKMPFVVTINGERVRVMSLTTKEE